MARYTRVSDERKRTDGRFEELHPDEQQILLEWIQKFFKPESRQSINSRYTAYGLKHTFGNSEFGFYLFSREFAEAMEKAGFQSERTPWGDWWFNVDEADVRRADKAARELQPITFGIRNPACLQKV